LLAATFAAYARDATAALERNWYANAAWRECRGAPCRVRDSDWGADALTATLALRRSSANDATTLGPLRALLGGLPRYGAPCVAAPCAGWSDVPLWDAVAALQAAAATRSRATGVGVALAAFAQVDATRVYAGGACPEIDYQQAFGGTNRLKTLETDANYVRAALLLHRATGGARFLEKARARYAAIRRWFFEPASGLYTAYLFDDGTACRPLPRRTFASVNGAMIWNGLELARATGAAGYREQALGTARAIAAHLVDGAGVFADVQAENDVVEPLVEAMLRVAREERAGFAREWILRNAAAARRARRSDGDYGRFFDGPPPANATTAWQVNGGFALEIAAAALAPQAAPPLRRRDVWVREAGFVLGARPRRLSFTGFAVALYGTLGERCCEAGHARVLVDGVETFDRTGIWQNKSSASRPLPDALLFAWRWRTFGRHLITLLPGTYDAKEGGAFLHVASVAYSR
jgi:hypothetical protein